MAYSVSGTLSPVCSTENTGVPAGVYDGESYWTWTNDAGTWYLSKWGGNLLNPDLITWGIGPRLGISGISEAGWQSDEQSETGPVGSYSPNPDASGTATVTEIAAFTTYATFTINDGPLAGQYIVLKTG